MTDPAIILVVDDDEPIQAFVEAALTDEGYAVYTASDGVQALQIVARHRPSLILLDLRMPNMDGLAFTRAYQQMDGPHATVIIMTAGRSPDGATDGLNIQGILAKPFDLEDLLKLIHQYLQ